jgi:hypothetical protein
MQSVGLDKKVAILPIDHVGAVWNSTKRIQTKSDFSSYKSN